MIAVRTLIFTLIVCFAGVPMSTAGPRPAFIKTELKQNEKVWPGQQQVLSIKLYTSTSFSGSTRFELPEVSGLLMMESEDRPLLGTEKVDGSTYIFKQHEILLFPWRSGSLAVPSFTVEFAFQTAEEKVAEQNFSTHKLQFRVQAIPGADPHNPVITTNDFQVKDHWQPTPGKSKTGDAFTRTVTMTANDLPGMAFPPLALQKVNGLGQYTKQPQVADTMQRGDFTGKRIETISYVCEQEGSFTIPAQQIQWWNPGTEVLKHIVLKEVQLEVLANPLLQQDSPVDRSVSKREPFPWKWLLSITLFLVVCMAGAWFYHRRKPREPQVPDKVEEFFQEFQQSATSGDAAATMRALCHWLAYSTLIGNSGSLSQFVQLAEDPKLSEEIEALETTLYGREEKRAWSGDRLYSAVLRAIKKLKQHESHGVQHSLPALNP